MSSEDERISFILKNWDQLSEVTKAMLRSVGINGDITKQKSLNNF